MQTSINENMALGIAGEHANTQPWFADAFIAATDVTFGGLAGRDANGKIGTHSATYSEFVGIFVSPHEHVKQVLPTGERSLTVKAGETVAVARKGSWFIAQAASDATPFKKGDKLKISSYAFAIAGSEDVAVVEVIDGTADDNVVAVRFL